MPYSHGWLCREGRRGKTVGVSYHRVPLESNVKNRISEKNNFLIFRKLKIKGKYDIKIECIVLHS